MNVAGQHITILGAGLTGSLLATLLAARGMQVLVLERSPDPRADAPAAGRSINLAMAARGLAGLERAGLTERVRHLLCPMPGRLLHARDGSTLFQPYSVRPQDTNYSVSRAGLNAMLVTAAEAAGAEIRFRQRCLGFEPDGNTLHLEDTSGDPPHRYTVQVQRLIAADGAGSPVRRALAKRPEFNITESLLDHKYQEVAIPASPDGDYVMEPAALHIWPRGGHMLIALPNPAGDFTATLFMRESAPDDEPSFAWWREPERALAWFTGEFGDVPTWVPDLAEQLVRHPLGVMGTVRCDRWHLEDRCLLIGDAAHAIVPFHGQGMNAAFEDCVVLDRLLDRCGDWQTVFAEFSAARIPNANAIARMALENYTEMRDTVRDPGFHVQKALAFELERRAPEQFVSRYALVMFHPDVSYATALNRGQTQAELLREWTAGCADIGEVDVAGALAAARDRLPPLSQESGTAV